MPRTANPNNLKIDLQSESEKDVVPAPNSSPMNLHGVDITSMEGGVGLTSLPPLPASPTSPRHNRDPSKSFFGNYKASMSQTRIQPEPQQGSIRKVSEGEDDRPGSSAMSRVYHLRNNPGSTPELSLVGSTESFGKEEDDPKPPKAKKEKKERKGFGLTRTKSTHEETSPKPKSKKKEDVKPNEGKKQRNRSADRAKSSDSDVRSAHKDSSGFLSNIKKGGSKAASGFGNAMMGLGKIGRSGSSNEREMPTKLAQKDKDLYWVLRLPLVEQTRKTRICPRLPDCKDKTEYWMPALPWRCIDYLNQQVEGEGLYRVPGGVLRIEHYRRRFDSELDINLLNETDLNDPNIITSLFKGWLTTLPDEVLPSEVQQRIAEKMKEENENYVLSGQKAPQVLRDELSMLSPFHYYLLFAITCHLSLMVRNQAKNKMSMDALATCIIMPLKIEKWLFNYLVGDWSHCWQGCYTEREFYQAELAATRGTVDRTPAEPSTGGSPIKKPRSAEDMRATASRDGKRFTPTPAKETPHLESRNLGGRTSALPEKEKPLRLLFTDKELYGEEDVSSISTGDKTYRGPNTEESDQFTTRSSNAWEREGASSQLSFNAGHKQPGPIAQVLASSSRTASPSNVSNEHKTESSDGSASLSSKNSSASVTTLSAANPHVRSKSDVNLTTKPLDGVSTNRSS